MCMIDLYGFMHDYGHLIYVEALAHMLALLAFGYWIAMLIAYVIWILLDVSYESPCYYCFISRVILEHG